MPWASQVLPTAQTVTIHRLALECCPGQRCVWAVSGLAVVVVYRFGYLVTRHGL